MNIDISKWLSSVTNISDMFDPEYIRREKIRRERNKKLEQLLK